MEKCAISRSTRNFGSDPTQIYAHIIGFPGRGDPGLLGRMWGDMRGFSTQNSPRGVKLGGIAGPCDPQPRGKWRALALAAQIENLTRRLFDTQYSMIAGSYFPKPRGSKLKVLYISRVFC